MVLVMTDTSCDGKPRSGRSCKVGCLSAKGSGLQHGLPSLRDFVGRAALKRTTDAQTEYSATFSLQRYIVTRKAREPTNHGGLGCEALGLFLVLVDNCDCDFETASPFCGSEKVRRS